jgi:methyl-accepting chemotaxis protein
LIENAKQEVALNAGIMMAAAKSARSYTVDEVRPLLHELNSEEFLPQTVPAYSATESMKRMRKTFPDYTYKEAALNPTNPEHKAADWEEDIIHYFQTYEDVKEYTGVRDTPTGQYLFLSRPFKITNQACLACHSDPNIAPPNLIKRYGSTNGFGWKHNEIIGAQIVNVPMSIPLARADEAFTTFMIILGAIFIVIWLILNLLLYLVIIKRIDAIALTAEKISKGDMSSPELKTDGKDEIDSLGHSFNLIYRSLCSAVKLLDKTQAGMR